MWDGTLKSSSQPPQPVVSGVQAPCFLVMTGSAAPLLVMLGKSLLFSRLWFPQRAAEVENLSPLSAPLPCSLPPSFPSFLSYSFPRWSHTLAWNSLCSPDWPWKHGDPPDSASPDECWDYRGEPPGTTLEQPISEVLDVCKS